MNCQSRPEIYIYMYICIIGIFLKEGSMDLFVNNLHGFVCKQLAWVCCSGLIFFVFEVITSVNLYIWPV